MRGGGTIATRAHPRIAQEAIVIEKLKDLPDNGPRNPPRGRCRSQKSLSFFGGIVAAPNGSVDGKRSVDGAYSLVVVRPARSHAAGSCDFRAFRRRNPPARRGLRPRGRLSDRPGPRHHLRDPVWTTRSTTLPSDYRVIAFDHRGHGRSDASRAAAGYSLDHLACRPRTPSSTPRCRPGERAVIAGHSMGGIAIASWADRSPRRVAERADAVALINTTTGDLLRELQPAAGAGCRWPPAGPCRAQGVIRAIGWAPRAPRRRSPDQPQVRRRDGRRRRCRPRDRRLRLRPVRDHPAGRPRRLRRGCSSTRWVPEHIELDGLTVPTLVIGSDQGPAAADRAVPQDRRGRAEPGGLRGAARRPLLDPRTPRGGQPPPA